MADVFSKEKRSDVMSRIRSRGNERTELRLAEIMRAAGITGWRRNQNICGKPDFIFRHERVAVFVDGCFWHGCPKCYRRPGSNQEYWDRKFERNRSRDIEVTQMLQRKGWRVVRIWAHQLKHSGRIVWRLRRALGRTLK